MTAPAPPRPYPPARGRLAVLEEIAFLDNGESLAMTPKGMLRVRYHGWSDLTPSFTYSLAGVSTTYDEAVLAVTK